MSYLDNTYGMKDLHQMLLDMMVEIDAVCRKHGIEYTLLGGTMLGAVRHQGFIPWDDDIDLAFTADALEQFSRVFPQESKAYTVTFDDTWVARVVPRQPINGQRPFVDLFHYQGISASPIQQKIKVLLLQLLQGMLKENADFSRFSLKNRILLGTTHALGLLLPKQTKLRLYRWVGAHVFTGDGSLVHIPDEQFACIRLVYPQAVTREFTDTPFETLTLRMSRHYHDMLVLHYGDYMTPPPQAERVGRHEGQHGA